MKAVILFYLGKIKPNDNHLPSNKDKKKQLHIFICNSNQITYKHLPITDLVA